MSNNIHNQEEEDQNNSIEKNRKIVLESIGENDKQAQTDKADIKKMDSIKPAPAIELNRKVFSVDSVNFLNSSDWTKAPVVKTTQNKSELEKKFENNQISTALIQNINKKNIGFDDLLKVSKKSKDQPKKTIAKKSAKITKTATTFEREKTITKKRKRDYTVLASIFKKHYKRSLFQIALFIFSTILLYLCLVVTILMFDLDKPALRAISRYLPIPAFIADGKVIGYYFWADLKKTSASSDDDKILAEAKIRLAEFLAINRLAQKYGIGLVSSGKIYDAELRASIAEKAFNDPDVNQVAINRIESIKDKINNKEDFYRVSEKYGDELGKATINDKNQEEYPFSKSISHLRTGDISEIIPLPDGFYIFQCNSCDDENLAVSYVKVRNKSFSDLLAEIISGYRIISFVD